MSLLPSITVIIVLTTIFSRPETKKSIKMAVQYTRLNQVQANEVANKLITYHMDIQSEVCFGLYIAQSVINNSYTFKKDSIYDTAFDFISLIDKLVSISATSISYVNLLCRVTYKHENRVSYEVYRTQLWGGNVLKGFEPIFTQQYVKMLWSSTYKARGVPSVCNIMPVTKDKCREKKQEFNGSTGQANRPSTPVLEELFSFTHPLDHGPDPISTLTMPEINRLLAEPRRLANLERNAARIKERQVAVGYRRAWRKNFTPTINLGNMELYAGSNMGKSPDPSELPIPSFVKQHLRDKVKEKEKEKEWQENFDKLMAKLPGTEQYKARCQAILSKLSPPAPAPSKSCTKDKASPAFPKPPTSDTKEKNKYYRGSNFSWSPHPSALPIPPSCKPKAEEEGRQPRTSTPPTPSSTWKSKGTGDESSRTSTEDPLSNKFILLTPPPLDGGEEEEIDGSEGSDSEWKESECSESEYDTEFSYQSDDTIPISEGMVE